MSDAHADMERLRTALKEEGVLTDPAALTDAGIDRIVALAHRAHAALEADRIRR